VVDRFELRDVRVDGDNGPILDGLSGRIPAVGLTAIVGESGTGKSTLVRLLNRLDDPDAGQVLFEGRDVRDHDVLELRRRVQVVGQTPVGFPGTVAHNLAGAADIAALLARVGLGAELAHREGDRLSLGETQRLVLARALTRQPEVLVLDEPTAALDLRAKARIEQLLGELADDGMTVVLVSHDPRHAEELADHVIELGW
jgi:putative ABC transport system ATP-binding protein